MSLPVQLNKKLSQSTNLLIAEDIAAYNRKTERIKLSINIGLISIEYILYIIGFLTLFYYKVVSDYDSFTWSELHTSIAKIPVLADYALLIGIIFTIYTAMLYQQGMFKRNRDIRMIDDTISAIKAVSTSFLIALGIAFFLKTSIVYSRVLILMLAILMVFIFLLSRIMRNYAQVLLHRSRRYNKNVLIIGAGKVGIQIRNHVMANTSCHFVGFLDDYKNSDQVLGTIQNIEQLIARHKVQEIYITIPSEKNIINELITSIRKYDVQIKIIPELFELVTSSISFDQAYDYPCIEIVKTPLRGLNLFLKRAADIILSLLGIIMISPILLIVALFIKFDSKGPVFIHQKRIGKNGAPFHMHKFRSMVNNAEELKEQLEKYNEADGPAFKMKNDPRITRVGRFIRKFSIDELPQLFNVLKGEMSLIGPRPPLPNEVEQYSDFQWRRLDIRPGITGLWQVSGRSDINFDEWVKLDLYYIEKWSISLELKILIKTIPVVLKGEGAY
ncbi:sugar transferase [Paenibacillus sp. chi10]|uniref:Sugar transferase n=1 Tax=Paenibacillus suaedae TaxID=3077233 RepID=A0AAJ2JZD7_9BACL|nr:MULTISPECIES: sugar transferase [Paenibacillus]EPY09437.1 exopolysaccharide biosynthesis polyprenyl glycosylphosphotransferase [Paenibacillus alvei A6-6i-x]MDT8979765.1 sugar transferase [Paenibacillus sp. chi10]